MRGPSGLRQKRNDSGERVMCRPPCPGQSEHRALRSRGNPVPEHLQEESVGNIAQRIVERQLVLSALRTLPIEQRQVLLESYFRGASVAEAAETLGLPAGTVKSRTYYALRTLREAIDAMGGVA
jgi:RNA polymerase sigma-70 factor, ECF subfamily